MDQEDTWGVNWPVGSTQFAYTSLDGCCSFPGAGIKDQPRAPSSDAGTLDYSMADTALDVSYTPIDSTIDLTGLDAVTAEDTTALIDGPI